MTELKLGNLPDEVCEAKNVAAEHPGVVARLQKQGEQARAELGDSRTNRGRHRQPKAGPTKELKPVEAGS